MCLHDSPLSRRAALRAGLGAAAALGVGARALWAGEVGETSIDIDPLADRPYLADALRAARWIDKSAVKGPTGVSWPADPLIAKSVETSLYTGTPGIVLFFLELGRTTGDRRWMDRACAGADWLAASLPAKLDPKTENAGLYTGVAGIAFTLAETARLSGRERYREDAKRALALLRDGAQPAGRGVAWSESNDIISGSAGIGLALLWASHTFGGDEWTALAAKAGTRLLERGTPDRGGLKWSATPGFPRTMPNFSHGAAGVSYFLASLHDATHDAVFQDGALAGAHYLQSVATTTPNDGRMVFHSEPGNETLFYLSWCHGPAGTARLFHRLGASTRDSQLTAYVDRLAEATVASGIPEQRTAGYWQNISQCCGNSGVQEFMLALSRRAATSGDTGARDRWRSMARRCAADTLRRATVDGDGLKWVQAENRVSPDQLIAQTGLMQGAAGVGLTLLHQDAAERGAERVIVLPDDPWG